MASEAELIVRTLDRHLAAAADIRLFGGAALVLGYGRSRATEDVDVLLDDAECQVLVENAGFSEAVAATNLELEPRGLYLTHIWGPEQQILTPEWRTSCRPIKLAGLAHARLSTLGPLDLIVSKLARADEVDLEDVRHLIERERLSSEVVRAAVARAAVPDILSDAFEASRGYLEGLLGTLDR